MTNGTDDLVSAKLPALQEYQLSIAAPAPPADSFNAAAAARGKMVFEGAGKCATCHSGSEFTDANSKLHDPSEVVSEPEPNGVPSYASRTATKKYRTAPLKGLWQHPPYFHNGSAATLEVVVDTYDSKKPGVDGRPEERPRAVPQVSVIRAPFRRARPVGVIGEHGGTVYLLPCAATVADAASGCPISRRRSRPIGRSWRCWSRRRPRATTGCTS